MSNNLLSRYPVFENNQVLTSSQLNLLAGYLDEQTRITRTRLIGVGIVCGLEQSVSPAGNDVVVKITEGKGVTTEGFLISITGKAYTKYKPYTLPSGVSYDPFLDSSLLQVPLWEMYEASSTVTSTSPLSQAFVDGTGPNNGGRKVVLLFLECKDVDLHSCLGRACDDLGMDRVFTLRALLANETDVSSIIQADMLAANVTFSARFAMPDVRMLRPLFSPAGTESSNYFSFQQNYVTALRKVYDTNGNIPSIFDLIRDSYQVFQPILQPVYGSNPVTAGSIAAYKSVWDNIINNINVTGPNYMGAQYFYDFMKDLLLAYNEFREASADLISRCCVSSGYFPKHLVLGFAQNNGQYSVMPYRTNFIASQASAGQHELEQHVIVLHKRMVLLMETFNGNLIHNPSGNQTILITPSVEKQTYLTPRAIPYYYQNDISNFTSLPAALNVSLESQWNYENLRRGIGSGTDYPVLGYHNQNNTSINGNYITKPLNFDLDPYNFLRIEGYLKKNYSQVLTDIDTIRTTYNLPFNVMAVRLQGQLTAAQAKAVCPYNDLDVLYRSLRAELKAKLGGWLQRATNLQNYVQSGGDFFDQLFLETTSTSSRTSVAFSTQTINSVLNNPVLVDSTTYVAQRNSPSEPLLANSTPSEPPPANRSTERIASPSSNNSSSSVLHDYVEPRVPAGPNNVLQPSSMAVDYVLATLPAPVANRPSTIGNVISDLTAIIGQNTGMIRYLNNLLNDVVLAETLSEFDFGYRPQVVGEEIPLAAPNTTLTVDTSFLLSYQALVASAVNAKANLMLLLDQVTHTLAARFPQEFYFSFGQWASEQIWFLNSLISDQTYRAIEKVYYQYLYRVGFVMANDPSLFKNFIRRHPGVDHKAGVQPGGTFVVVYPGENVTLQSQTLQSSNVAINPAERSASNTNVAVLVNPALTPVLADQAIADFSLPYPISCDCFCEEIPTPTDDELLQPSYSMLQFNDYNPGDFAFAENTYGIPVLPGSNQTTQPINISVERWVNYNRNFDLRLYGLNSQGQATRATFTTAMGGRVQIATVNGEEVFRYTPPAQLIISDYFDYVFETVDATQSPAVTKTRSNRARVILSVTERFPAPLNQLQSNQDNPVA
ncbi:MAG: hypothetical protein MUC87_05140 [Bacteroidia bacterium]|jgi:hypothetical protein|nr:hypothetical protein [Bacteroidia bacterium]